MWKIILLDKELANQIAAWEVVERPVSVIKELIENSIDANSTKIHIEIKNWWIDEIVVFDNWDWIEKEDLILTMEKHATSKIKNINDLYNVMTFWFRWEALSSISSVSDFKIISKNKDSKKWYSLYEKELKEEPINNWTKIIVKNLFYNTPARLNYLKKPKTEYSHILNFINNMAIWMPHIWFSLVSDWKQIINYKENESIKTRIYYIFSEEFLNNLIEINFNDVWINIKWYISDPKVSFSNKNRQILYINNRIVNSPIVYKAISNAYNRFIPHNNFPSYILKIDIDPTQVDVNVHPRKQELRFANEASIFRSVFHNIENKLNQVSLVKNDSFNNNNEHIWEKIEKKETYFNSSWSKFKSYSPYKEININPNQQNIKDAINFSREILFKEEIKDQREFEKSNDLHDTPIWKIIWQSFNSYIIVESKDSIKILDQHALAERVIYEKLISNKYKQKTQWLLIWESLKLTSKEIDIIENNKEILEEMWFDFEIMSNSIVIINWIPDFIKKENIENIFLWIIEDISSIWAKKSKTLDEIRNKIFAYTACRSAIKFWNKLNLFEINKLLNDSSISYSSTCPHWRPVVFEINLEDLKNKYER